MSRLDARRLRAGEIIAGASATLLLILLFAVQWYAVSGPVRETLARGLHEPTTFNGWDGLEHLRWLLLVTILVALALTFFQAAREGPAIPITLSVILTVLAGLSTVALIIRVLIKTPGHMLDQRAGAYLGLAATIGITYGAFKSMREEGGTDPAVLDIETIRLQNGP